MAKKTGHDTSTKRYIINNNNYKANTKRSVKINGELELLSELNKQQNNMPRNLSCHSDC